MVKYIFVSIIWRDVFVKIYFSVRHFDDPFYMNFHSYSLPERFCYPPFSSFFVIVSWWRPHCIS